ncbi:hypothetical protein DCCM_3708 [Desulfocucumis palustris]|uniref:Uncharacterized protein n=1 Tax=Desulfocucumis palustris TaxID=1898651 RepID=A0A2L2XDZ9_9FIRM|nr:hypothetical protein DCCM_3708 [Desulfocucumis palustris]
MIMQSVGTPRRVRAGYAHAKKVWRRINGKPVLANRIT